MNRKSVNVDFILNNWFGEPPEHSNNERTLIRHLYEPLRKIERQRDSLLEALRAMLEQFNYNTITGIVHDESAAIVKARAIIKAVEEGK